MRVIAEDLWFPEGPVWVGDGSLLVVEIRRKTLTRVWPGGRKKIVAELGGGPNGAAMGSDGYCYVANNGGFKFTQRADGRWVTAGTPDDYLTGRIERVDIDTGKFETVCDRIGNEDPRPERLVSMRTAASGSPTQARPAPRWDRGSVCMKANGSMAKEVIFPITSRTASGFRRTARRSTSPRPNRGARLGT
jgi:gluconolactonase